MRSLGYHAAFDVSENKNIKIIGSVEVDSSGIDPRKFQEADGTWRSLISTCKGVAFDIVGRAESPSEAWRQLTAYYQVESMCEQRRLQKKFGSLKMKSGDDPKEVTLKVDRVVAKMKRAGLDIKKDYINVAVSNGLSRVSTRWKQGSWIARLILQDRRYSLSSDRYSKGYKERTRTLS